MNNEDKSKRITELSDSDFLSFLYAEREREESQNNYQGWNLWAIGGAIIAVVCAAYSLSRNNMDIDFVQTLYLLSGIVSFVMCYRPFLMILMIIAGRERSVDDSKVKKLKDVFPILYVFLALISSIGFAIILPMVDKSSSNINLISILWTGSAILNIILVVVRVLYKEKLVKTNPISISYVNIKFGRIIDALIACVLCFIWTYSFRKVTGPIWGSPNFELAVCLAAILFLFYFGANILKDVKKTSEIDVLLDEYLYKGVDKDIICKKLIINRMGYSVLEVCAYELGILKKSVATLEEHKSKINDLNGILDDGSFDVNRMQDYIEELKISDSFARCLDNAKTLLDKLNQILNLNVSMVKGGEYQYVSSEVNSIVESLKSYMNLYNIVERKLSTWMQVYYCEKYGGLCVEDCPHRHDK